MRTVVLAFLFAALGSGTAWVAARQSGSGGVKNGIPAANAEQIKSQLSEIEGLVDEGNCNPIGGKISLIVSEIDNLPRSTNKALKKRLRSGLNRLLIRAKAECKDNQLLDTTVESVPSTSDTVPSTATVPSSSTATTTTAPPSTQTQTKPSTNTQTQTNTQTSTRTTPQPTTSPSGGGAGSQSTTK